jgi:hypothetical protein
VQEPNEHIKGTNILGWSHKKQASTLRSGMVILLQLSWQLA